VHYKIDGITIKSEYAAKSVKQQNSWVISFINKLPTDSVVLDYGCGKLRYTIPLLNRVKEVVAVDSRQQVQRIQKIEESITTLKDYARKKRNLSVLTIEEFNLTNYFDWAFCTNVLSAIPFEHERIKVLRTIKKALNKNGRALITTQFRNSYFKTYESRENVIKFYDGWLINNKNNYSFYGIIPPDSLEELCVKSGFNIIECRSKGETAYAIVEN
jgi:2-polyprenyl-3-methyl-5-hydroxy-6-metoxy-1,4-benzoquinol methylase